MSAPILATKLYIPPVRPGIVQRPRLIERLNEGVAAGCKLALVSAPAGYGKTTLISFWLQETKLPSAWLSLDKADNDPIRLWTYAIAALQKVQEGIGTAALAALQSPQPPAIEALLTILINDIADRGSEPLTLVLDDFHLITAPPILEALFFLLEHLPPSMHLILAGRADPPWPLARLRARGEMIELRTDDLRFTAAEVAAFLNNVMGLELSADDLTALEDRTEGWIVGLQMAALSMQGRKDASAFIRAFHSSHRFILDYLLEEVLDRQPPDVQDFLQQTAVLDRMTASLCDALTDRQDSHAVLARMEQANLFLVPLDDGRRWYRYHHLFADLLRSRLERSQPNKVVILNKRASEWYGEQNLIVEAVMHAQAAHDVERVAHLAEKNVLGMMDHGNLGILVEWLNALPGEMMRSRPWLCIARAWALAYTGSFEAVTPCLQDVALALGDGQQPGSELHRGLALDEVAHIRGHIDAIRCYILNVTYGDYRLAIELAQSALAQLPESDWRARGRVAVLLGLGHRLNMDFVAAHEALVKALAIARAAEQKYVVIDVVCQIARVEGDQGTFRQAAATCREALRLAEEYERSGHSRLPAVSSALILLSRILYQWNDLPAALDYARQALALARQWGQMDSLVGGYISLIMIQIASREFDTAFESIQEMKRLYNTPGSFPKRPVALEALCRLAMNDVPGAAQRAAELVPHMDEGWRMTSLIPVYLAQFRQGSRTSLDDILSYLSRSLQTAEAAGSRIVMAQTLVWQAMALQALGRVEEACPTLTRALSIAEPDGYVRVFIDEGAPMGELLTKVLADQRTRRDEASRRMADYVSRLLSALAGKMPVERTAAPFPSALVEPLSEREMEVLRLLASPLSTPEIARELVVSANTVRSHVKSIYAKLNTHGRIEALQRARELGLLP
jgi:LuxR family maltose regulon positive regulatory protein